jgi:hypothetical protein
MSLNNTHPPVMLQPRSCSNSCPLRYSYTTSMHHSQNAYINMKPMIMARELESEFLLLTDLRARYTQQLNAAKVRYRSIPPLFPRQFMTKQWLNECVNPGRRELRLHAHVDANKAFIRVLMPSYVRRLRRRSCCGFDSSCMRETVARSLPRPTRRATVTTTVTPRTGPRSGRYWRRRSTSPRGSLARNAQAHETC